MGVVVLLGTGRALKGLARLSRAMDLRAAASARLLAFRVLDEACARVSMPKNGRGLVGWKGLLLIGERGGR